MSELFTRYIHLPPRIQEERHVGPLGRAGLKPVPRIKGWHRAFQPALEVADAPNCYLVRLDLPGVRREDLEVTVQGEELVIQGCRNPEPGHEGPWRGERGFGNFTRKVQLPEHVDSNRVEAVLNSGVLTLTVPKWQPMTPRKVRVGHQRRFIHFGS
ncbi:MAG: Hsp20/alpha crystallin family protein [Acidobacteria bacterium]|nr:Hsp20/alpha crystallin family protein [Acidobacteriota bacterium]